MVQGVAGVGVGVVGQHVDRLALDVLGHGGGVVDRVGASLSVLVTVMVTVAGRW